MNDTEVLQVISAELGLAVKDRQMIADRVNDLINSDFQRLVSILYRMDVNETRLKQLLSDNPGTDAGIIIADLMIERQEQKIKSRQAYKPDENISDEEKW